MLFFLCHLKVVLKGIKIYYPSFKYFKQFTTTNEYININAKLYGGTNYTVSVSAVTGVGEGNKTSISFQTANERK